MRIIYKHTHQKEVAMSKVRLNITIDKIVLDQAKRLISKNEKKSLSYIIEQFLLDFVGKGDSSLDWVSKFHKKHKINGIGPTDDQIKQALKDRYKNRQ